MGRKFYRIRIGSVFNSAITSDTLRVIQNKRGERIEFVDYYRGPPKSFDGDYEKWKGYCIKVGGEVVAQEWPMWKEIEVTVGDETFTNLCCDMIQEESKINSGLISLIEIIDEDNTL